MAFKKALSCPNGASGGFVDAKHQLFQILKLLKSTQCCVVEGAARIIGRLDD
jgi:hypothetical protein